jgi:hypothetical protein
MRGTIAAAVLLGMLLLGTSALGSAQPATGQSSAGWAFEFGLIGDLPYSFEDDAKFPALIAEMNAANLAFVVHNGDFKTDSRVPAEASSRSGPCTDELFYEVRDIFQTSRHPLIYTPGDNEWTDCHFAPGGIPDGSEYNPVERLAKLREIFFQGDQSLGQRPMQLARQSENPAYAKFRENARWTYGDVTFATLHVVGSNNNLGRTPDDDAEYAERNAANLVWLRQAFEAAQRANSKGMMIVWQANPFRQYDFPVPPAAIQEQARSSGFVDLVQALEAETVRFGKPVVLVHGDTHYFRIDKPLRNSTTGRRVENFTRVETFGTPDVHWVRVAVDYSDPELFTFRQGIVEQNRLNHLP